MSFIPVNTPLLDGNEKKYVNDCLDSGWISSEGSYVLQFEENFAAVVNRKYGIAVSNGSVALDAAVVALGIGEGDEVIMPTFTILILFNSASVSKSPIGNPRHLYMSKGAELGEPRCMRKRCAGANNPSSSPSCLTR